MNVNVNTTMSFGAQLYRSREDVGLTRLKGRHGRM